MIAYDTVKSRTPVAAAEIVADRRCTSTYASQAGSSGNSAHQWTDTSVSRDDAVCHLARPPSTNDTTAAAAAAGR